jgi:hypothetical protein
MELKFNAYNDRLDYSCRRVKTTFVVAYESVANAGSDNRQTRRYELGEAVRSADPTRSAQEARSGPLAALDPAQMPASRMLASEIRGQGRLKNRNPGVEQSERHALQPPRVRRSAAAALQRSSQSLFGVCDVARHQRAFADQSAGTQDDRRR